MFEYDVVAKAERGEKLTPKEVCEYKKLVKPVKHLYGKYGNLAKTYLEKYNQGKLMLIENIPEYLHNIDKQAEDLYDSMYKNLSKQDRYKKTGEFIKDVQKESEMQSIIGEEILSTIVYVD